MNRLLKRISFFASIRDKIKQERQNRLGKVGDNVLPTKSAESPALIRNIGIIAHIDAGKTTTTERMLYYAGALPSPGNIDEGTTTMDYLKQQRQRGITIRSAAISFAWNKCQINLIDTPGHVDFSGQVTRSLRVLDGAITILDGGKGVQAQTVKVWRQAERRSTPKMCFINKLDRIGSSVQRTAEAIQSLLGVQPLIFQMPIGQGQNFKGVVDLLTMQSIKFQGKYGEKVVYEHLKQDSPLFSEAQKKRQALIERIANYDDVIGELYLNEQHITISVIKSAVRRMLNNPAIYQKVTPVFLGAAYKNKGVQPLLDAVVDYLPSPTQRPPVVSTLDQSMVRKPIKAERFSAYTFKVICDEQYGVLSYARIYSGQLKKNSSILNTSKMIPEKINQLFRVRANQYVPLHDVSAGDIVAIAGLKQTRAGQTLADPGDNLFLLEKLQLPAAIFTVPIEMRSNHKQKQLFQAINKAVLEDNSLIFKQDKETGQYLLSGLGQLHLQIVKDKLNEQGFNVRLGKLKIGYRQTVSSVNRKTLSIRTQLKNGGYEQFQLTLEVAPLRDDDNLIEDKVNVVFTFPKVDGFEENWHQYINKKQIKRGQKKNEDQTRQTFQLQKSNVKKSTRNPTPIEPLLQGDPEAQQSDIIEEEIEQDDLQQDEEYVKNEDQQEPFYHINTLPFDTLDQLVEQCRVALNSGSNGYPTMGIELRICGGKFQKRHFSKTIMNRTASQLARQLLSNTTLIEPFLEFRLEGEEAMIDQATTDIMVKKRGRINEQTQTMLTGVIPAASVRGWIKELRIMGFDVQMKFSGYEQIVGTDPKKLLEENL